MNRWPNWRARMEQGERARRIMANLRKSLKTPGNGSEPTEATITAAVEDMTGTEPRDGDFLNLLTDPEYDRRATAVPAAREEQE